MATPNPQSQSQSEPQSLPIQSHSSSRKLPIKRSPHPTTPHLGIGSCDDHDDVLDDEDDDLDLDEYDGGGGGGDPKTVPFKFHRIWSETEEIRLLQGLLGCWSRGMVFPRDLNVFFDQFSESMQQPYTRSQLSEKLRRLRRKFRTLSGRVARGQDPSRLAPHDRDVLHLCTRLWHPSYASSSPFSSPDFPSSRGRSKRQRPNPASPPPVLLHPPETTSPTASGVAITASTTPSLETNLDFDDKGLVDVEVLTLGDFGGLEEVTELDVEVIPESTGGNVGAGRLTAKTILEVFDELSNQTRMERVRQMEMSLAGSELERRWKEQRAAELDVLTGRLRLVLENSIRDLN